MRMLPLLILATACNGCVDVATTDDTEVASTPAPTVRVATYNTSFFQDEPGKLLETLRGGRWLQGRQVASVLQEIRPDVVLLNEVDTDTTGAVGRTFVQEYLKVGQDGREPLDYPHVYVAPVNTGLHSGFDLDNDGSVDDSPGDGTYGGDAFGYGTFEGQYGMLVLSRHPITDSRTFQELPWSALPEPGFPDDYYTPQEQAALRLSSKSHWDLTLDVHGHPLHLLASHPTPPSFDGPEDRNGRRNSAEIRFWVEYIADHELSWAVDDAGQAGGLPADAPFVIVGDLNADPNDGDGAGGAISDLVGSPLVSQATPPASEGGAQAAQEQGAANRRHQGDPAHDTSDWDDQSVGNLRVDYALPSANVEVLDSGVFWPVSDDASAPLLRASDHRPVWVEIQLP